MKMEHSEPTLNYMASIMLHPRNKYLGWGPFFLLLALPME